jgi:hypothetical protein
MSFGKRTDRNLHKRRTLHGSMSAESHCSVTNMHPPEYGSYSWLTRFAGLFEIHRCGQTDRESCFAVVRVHLFN